MQFGTLIRRFDFVNADGLTSGTMRGTLSSILKALLLSTTKAPDAIADGASSLDLVAPALKNATSTPSKAVGSASSTE